MYRPRNLNNKALASSLYYIYSQFEISRLKLVSRRPRLHFMVMRICATVQHLPKTAKSNQQRKKSHQPTHRCHSHYNFTTQQNQFKIYFIVHPHTIATHSCLNMHSNKSIMFFARHDTIFYKY